MKFKEKKMACKFCALDSASVKKKAPSVPSDDEYKAASIRNGNTPAKLDCSLEQCKVTKKIQQLKQMKVF